MHRALAGDTAPQAHIGLLAKDSALAIGSAGFAGLAAGRHCSDEVF
jgi:hypothetical protein